MIRSPLKTVVSRKVISFSDISAVNFIVGWNNSEVGQEPITRREQLPCAHATAFSRTSLFLERFLARILNTF